jgi:hypothetical protein
VLLQVPVMLTLGELRTVLCALVVLAELGPVSPEGEFERGTDDDRLVGLIERLELEELVLY